MKQPAIYLAHGGGPCFFMDPPPEDPTRWEAMRDYLRALPSYLPEPPAALVVISAHWEMPEPTVLAAEHPALLYDYYHFPPHTYQLTYPARGLPALAKRLRELLAHAGIESASDFDRGFDHGIFIPLKVSFPEADIPIVQLSLQRGLDPARHLAIGRALAPLREENIVVIGSGLSFHNLAAFGDPSLGRAAAQFDEWLTETLCEVSPTERRTRLEHWTAAPHARVCHPREEHLLPLMVAAGAALQEPGHHTLKTTISGKAVSAYHFGSEHLRSSV